PTCIGQLTNNRGRIRMTGGTRPRRTRRRPKETSSRMARIAIVRLFKGMTITGAQIAGQLKAAGHVPLIVMFKHQEFVVERETADPGYEIGDTPMKGFLVNKDGVTMFESSIWRRTTPTELANLRDVLREFRPDAIGVSTLSCGMTLAERVTNVLREHFSVPIL